MARKPNGRKRIDIVRMQNRRNLQVTFSKRRFGLFKKASELCTLCGADVAAVVFSPGERVYSFGHPSVNSVVDRFLGVNPPPDNDVPNPLPEPHQNANIDEVNLELTQLEEILAAEKTNGKTLQAMRTEGPIQKLSLLQLQELSEILDAKQEKAERVALQQKECGMAFPYSTLGGALSPFGATENLSSGSDTESSESR